MIDCIVKYNWLYRSCSFYGGGQSNIIDYVVKYSRLYSKIQLTI